MANSTISKTDDCHFYLDSFKYTEGMNETLTICRHAHSGANVRGGEAFGRADARLDDQGVQQATRLGYVLENTLGIHPPTTQVATSTFNRAPQTAELAGFVELTSYEYLDEVPHGCESFAEWDLLKKNKLLQVAALSRAALLLEHYFDNSLHSDIDLPNEQVWITHGYMTAHLMAVARCRSMSVTRVHPAGANDHFIPGFCEIVQVSKET
jgi:Histidine phosphatase superfamily (branch 1)